MKSRKLLLFFTRTVQFLMWRASEKERVLRTNAMIETLKLSRIAALFFSTVITVPWMLDEPSVSGCIDALLLAGTISVVLLLTGIFLAIFGLNPFEHSTIPSLKQLLFRLLFFWK